MRTALNIWAPIGSGQLCLVDLWMISACLSGQTRNGVQSYRSYQHKDRLNSKAAVITRLVLCSV